MDGSGVVSVTPVVSVRQSVDVDADDVVRMGPLTRLNRTVVLSWSFARTAVNKFGVSVAAPRESIDVERVCEGCLVLSFLSLVSCVYELVVRVYELVVRVYDFVLSDS